MKTAKIAARMCKIELTAADTKAICKARGFSVADAESPGLLENLLVSPVGLGSAFSRLTRKETILLHLLKYIKKPVDITVFERLTEEKSNWSNTFNQQYGHVFKHIKTRLIRTGVLVFSTNPSLSYKKTKLEQRVFGFPEELHAHLPSPFESLAVLPGPGEFNDPFVRAKLHQLLGPVATSKKDPFDLNLKAGVLLMGESEFKIDAFRLWQQREWVHCTVPNLEYSDKFHHYFSPMATLNYAFSLLDPNQWIEPGELKPISDIFCVKGIKLDIHEVFHYGWEKACLVRQQANGKTCYRPARAFLEVAEDPRYGDYLHVDDAGGIRVDLETIPLKCLEMVSRIARFQLHDGCLTASPDIIRMGRVFREIQKDPLTAWLAETAQAFRKAFHTVSARWGKHLVHGNLMIAKVKNIGLKVTLEKYFKGETIIFLPGDFMAFPEALLNQIETLVTKNGFAVKPFDPSS